MGKVYFFCDSQRNLLSAYFMKQIYFRSDEYEIILLVSNNSDNSVACAKRIMEMGGWKKVEIIKEAFKDQIYLESLAQSYKITNEDTIGVFALQNRFARAFYKQAALVDASIMLIDEGVILFHDFLNWQKEHKNEMFADINVLDKRITAWCYEPLMYELPQNFVIKRIELREYLNDVEICKKMQTDVKTIFNVQDETCAEVIYFDQYYALSGRTIAEIERYFLDIISTICSEYDFYIKPHPMERGFDNKYKNISAFIIQSQHSPWEAVYFVNYYKKEKRKLICIAGESTAISSPLLMFGDKNYKLIILKDIYSNFILPSTLWSPDKYFNTLQRIYNENFYMPTSFEELNCLIRKLMESDDKDQEQIFKKTEKTLGKISKEIMSYRPTVITPQLQVLNKDGLIESFTVEHILENEAFDLCYDISDKRFKKYSTYRWVPHENCFICIKNLQVIITVNGKEEELMIKNFIPEQSMTWSTDGYCEINSIYPSFIINLGQRVAEKIQIKGKWRFDFSRERMLKALQLYYEQKASLRKDFYENKIQQLNSKLDNLEEIIRKQEDTIGVLKDNVHILKEQRECWDNKLNTIEHKFDDWENKRNFIFRKK